MPNKGGMFFTGKRQILIPRSWLSPAKPLNKKVITKQLSKNHSGRSELFLNDVELTILKHVISRDPKTSKVKLVPNAVLGDGTLECYQKNNESTSLGLRNCFKTTTGLT